jgi:hypothetical protein
MNKLTGCLLLFLIIAVISACLLPLTIFVGGFTSTTQADFVSGIMGKMICPENSKAKLLRIKQLRPINLGTE